LDWESPLDVFTRPLYVNEIIKSLQFCQEKKGLEIYAYEIMRNAAQTNHIHLVAARTEGEMSDVLRDFNRTGVSEFYCQAIIEFGIRKPKRISKRVDGNGF
jgi:REP element-mobilizing transposase RayT